MLCHDDLDSEMHTHLDGFGPRKHQPGERPGSPPMSAGVGLDKLSIKCLSCHDAVFAKDSPLANPVVTRETYMHNISALGLSHPIGMSYVDTKLKYFGAYRDIVDLPKEIKLFDNAVGCGSCHSLYSKLHYELVMSNDGSRLCLGCHVKVRTSLLRARPV